MAMIDGLVSGLDTTSLIRQLMQLERQPVVRLQASKAAIDAKVTAYQALNTRFSAIGDAAKALSSLTGWQATTATSSKPEALAVTSSPTATTGSLTVRVDSLATTHTMATAAVTGMDGQVAAAGSVIRFRVDGQTTDVDLGNGTLQGAMDAINAAGAGVTATAVQSSPGQYRLLLTSQTPGGGGAIEVLARNPGQGGGQQIDPLNLGTVTAAADAQLWVGGATGFAVTSSTNTFTDVIPGLTITAKAVSADLITIDVGTDHDTVADKVSALVDALNDALKHIKDQSAYNPESSKANVLTGDSTARRLQQDLLSAVSGGGTLADLGIELTRDGTVTFDRERFTAAHRADPAGVAERFTATDGVVDGFAKRLESLATSVTRSGTGLLTTAIEGRQTAARQVERQIDSWEPRLAMREAALRRQFAALEGALGNLQSQSNWLAGQLAGMYANSAAR